MSATTESRLRKTVVVGAGPVGALAALYAASRGDNVEVYELRGDLREPSTTPLNFTKSINLALSERGVNALRHANCPGLVEDLLKKTIPMHGRMIHGGDSKKLKYTEQSQAYDVHGRSIQAVDRGELNKQLLEVLDRMPNVKLFFLHKLTGADFNRKLAWFEKKDAELEAKNDRDRDPEVEVSFDFMVGADGAHSAVRFHMMKFARVSYQQEYIDTLWCEFHVPPRPKEKGGGYRLSPNHLHIWPAQEFMFIAIPSLDESFTCTLFMPATHFERLIAGHPKDLVDFFLANFPGVVPHLLGLTELRDQFRGNPHLPLISIKCTPYHYKSSCAILGDAAHAMVPFYGQGMNAGLEDVRVLFEFLDKHSGEENAESARADALAEYTEVRHPDARCINDLALQNYVEMRSSVQSPFYRARKWVDEHLDVWFPSLGWSSQYSRISFGNDRYSDVEKAVSRQGDILTVLGSVVTASAAIGAFTAWRNWR